MSYKTCGIGIRPARGLVERETQLSVSHCHEIEHQHHGDGISKEGAVGRSGRTQMALEDEDIVEDDVQQAHHRIEQTRHLYVPTASQTSCSQHVDLQHGKRQGYDREILRCTCMYLLVRTQPDGQRWCNQHPDQTQYETECKSGKQPLPDDPSCPLKVFCPNTMSHLYREARSERRTQPSKEPDGRRNQTHRSALPRAQVSQHRRIDDLHSYRRDLRYHGRKTQ